MLHDQYNEFCTQTSFLPGRMAQTNGRTSTYRKHNTLSSANATNSKGSASWAHPADTVSVKVENEARKEAADLMHMIELEIQVEIEEELAARGFLSADCEPDTLSSTFIEEATKNKTLHDVGKEDDDISVIESDLMKTSVNRCIREMSDIAILAILMKTIESGKEISGAEIVRRHNGLQTPPQSPASNDTPRNTRAQFRSVHGDDRLIACL